MRAESSMAQQILDSTASISRASFEGDTKGRLRALEQARALCRRLETPWDTLVREIWLSPSVVTALKICMESGILACLSTERAKSTAEIAASASCDVGLARRLLRLLAPAGYVEELDTDVYRGTELSESFCRPGFQGGMTYLFGSVLPTFTKMPAYFAEHGYKEPSDPQAGPWQYQTGTPEPHFEWIMQRPEHAKAFNDLMALFHEVAPYNWTKSYDVSQLLEESPHQARTNTPLVVDIGGGIGRDMENLRQQLLPAEPVLLVQDLGQAVNQGKGVFPQLTYQQHDFFDKQPVHGARAYFLHSVLHDWPDHYAKKILTRVRTAMDPAHSKLLICENILPERAQLPLGGALDLVMMGMLAAKERTEAQWRQLLTSSGFVVVRIWGSPVLGQCVLEAKVDEQAVVASL